MNWDAIGAVGEMVGAFAVIVTLAYLALQIREARTQSEADAFAVVAGQECEIDSRFMAHADVWIKGNAGGELSAPERFVFDQLVKLRADHHFLGFSRNVIRGTGREGVHLGNMALFLHQYPVAYRSWNAQRESIDWSRQRLGVSGYTAEWTRQLTEAVATLEET